MMPPSIQHLSTTTSTNRDLELLIHSALDAGCDFPEFSAVMADFQVAGRGQGTNRWHSTDGRNLLISICFRPPVPASRQFLFNEYFAIAVTQLLSRYIPDVKIKWPNDIYLNDRKLAGILIEHSVIGDRLAYSIAGLGLNVNETDFPADLPNPVSLSQITGKQYDVNEIAARLLFICQSSYSVLKEENWVSLENDFLSHLYRMEEWSSFIIENQEVEAKITGIDVYGRLLLEGRAGEKWCCGMKEIKFVI